MRPLDNKLSEIPNTEALSKVVLEVKNLTKRFGGLYAVNDVSLTVREGEVSAVIGPNGAGKSTLFKLITSFLRPTSGKVIYKGEDITGLRPHVIAQKGILRTFQEVTVFRDMCVYDAIMTSHQHLSRASTVGIMLNSSVARDDVKTFRQNTDRIIETLDLRKVAFEQAKNLSQGHLRSLSIAMALAANPKVLLLDEPFAGMNSEETERTATIIRELRDQGFTILLVEHDMHALMRISDRVSVISFGEKIAEGTPLEVQQNEAVIDAYLGKEDPELGI